MSDHDPKPVDDEPHTDAVTEPVAQPDRSGGNTPGSPPPPTGR